MPKRRLLHRARTIVTLRGEPGPRAGEAMSELSIVEHGSVAIDGQGRIAWVGPQAQVPAEYRDEAEVLDCRGKTLVPGLVDPHTHVVWAGHRRGTEPTGVGAAAEGGGHPDLLPWAEDQAED